MSWKDYIELGLGLSGLLVALVQTIRLREIKKRANADIWVAIQSCGSLLARIEESKVEASNSWIAAAYASGKELFRQLLKLAVIDEPRFTEETVEKWRQAERLRNDWQVLQVRQLLQTNQIKTRNETAKP